MNKITEKPTPEAKALSLFLQAYKTKDPIYKEKSKRINRLFDLVKSEELSRSDYMQEVQNMLALYGGYSVVVQKTVKYYIDKTGEWTLKGEDKYCLDAKKVADTLLNKQDFSFDLRNADTHLNLSKLNTLHKYKKIE